MDTLSYMQNDADTPVIPLPNPGEGGPVPDGEDESNFPVAPLPNPGEGGPVPDFDESQTPVIPLPNPGEGGPIPTFPERPNNGIWGSIITVFPRPIIPCYFCNTTQYGVVRFLNAAAGYNPFIIYINNQMVKRRNHRSHHQYEYRSGLNGDHGYELQRRSEYRMLPRMQLIQYEPQRQRHAERRRGYLPQRELPRSDQLPISAGRILYGFRLQQLGVCGKPAFDLQYLYQGKCLLYTLCV